MPTLVEMAKLHDELEKIQKLPEPEKLDKLFAIVNDLAKRVEYLEFRNACVDRR